MNGFDGSLFGGLTANSAFLDFFGGSNDGVRFEFLLQRVAWEDLNKLRTLTRLLR